MEKGHGIRILVGVLTPFLLVSVLIYAMYHCKRKQRCSEKKRKREYYAGGESEESEDLIIFPGGENLTVHDILDAPGEVIGKSCHGTLYRATLQGSSGGAGGSMMLLRFVQPACIGRAKEILPAVQLLGFVRHPNLVPLRAMYVGPRGEKLLVHPFFASGSLLHFLRGLNTDSCNWEVISKLSIGISKGLDYLHNGLLKPIIHGNLKSKNILLDADFQPHLSDYGLHLLLNPTSGQEMLEVSAAQGYRAPELIKMKDASKESDIYSLGVIFLEMIPRKEPMSRKMSSSWDLHLQSPMKDLNLEHKNVSEIVNSELLSQGKNHHSCITEEVLVAYFQLGKACCSPSPSLRPDIKQVIARLQEIGK